MPTHNLQQIIFTVPAEASASVREHDVLVDVFTRTDDQGRTQIVSAQMSERPAGGPLTWGQMTEGVLLPKS